MDNQPTPEGKAAALSRTVAPETESAADGPPRGTLELMFLADEDQAEQVAAWARRHLQPDPHCAVELGNGYRVNSLYLETSSLDVYLHTPGFRRTKCRLRRYGSDPTVWLEAKRKRAGIVRKRRTPGTIAEFLSHCAGLDPMTWDGEWFQRRLHRFSLRPICQVTYQRTA